MLVNSLKIISSLNELQLISLHTSMAIVYTRLNGFSYCYLPLIILFKISYWLVHSEVVTSIAI